ncbi:MAG: TetR/AcrR family transcriptional regulator [Rhodobacter sp.]|nr:TetR/AcrR family transcriptional regulator [Paracoccaceae bacterium]MCC0078623.1 TetR/AcrR family transcriptional regulator [Rhodobacter sp.]
MTPQMTPQDRFRALAPDARAFWLDPAEAAFVAQGYGATSVNRILDALGTSKGRFYHYFDGKTGLFSETLNRALSRVRLPGDGALSGAADAAGFWRGARALADALAAGLRRDSALAALLRDLYRDPEAMQAVTGLTQALRYRIEALILAGQRLGAVRRDLPVSLLAGAAFDLLLSLDRWFAAQTLPPAEAERLARTAFSLLENLLKPEAA